MPASPSPKPKRVVGRHADAIEPPLRQFATRSAPVQIPQDAAPVALPAPRIDALKRVKRVRNNVASSRHEQHMLDEIKAGCAAAGFVAKKNSLWRIGICQLAAMPVEEVGAMLTSLPPLKKRRSKK